ncbi:hypothetical protein NFI96_000203 [Prochilodus magdalenae]|nr:hypothetical protein NFI96_000203 [Prochilodus magdalenae]
MPLIRAQKQSEQLEEMERGHIVGLQEAGWCIERFMAQLVICAKGGATHQKTADIMDTLDQGADNAQRDLEQQTIAVFVIRREGDGLQEPPEDIGLVIEGVTVLRELSSVASACALLLASESVKQERV